MHRIWTSLSLALIASLAGPAAPSRAFAQTPVPDAAVYRYANGSLAVYMNGRWNRFVSAEQNCGSPLPPPPAFPPGGPAPGTPPGYPPPPTPGNPPPADDGRVVWRDAWHAVVRPSRSSGGSEAILPVQSARSVRLRTTAARVYLHAVSFELFDGRVESAGIASGFLPGPRSAPLVIGLDRASGAVRSVRVRAEGYDSPQAQFEVELSSDVAAEPSEPRCGGCNVYGCFVEGAGCNVYGCWSPDGGCNVYGCWAPGGGCNVYGCWSRAPECNVYGCQNRVDPGAGRASSRPQCE